MIRGMLRELGSTLLVAALGLLLTAVTAWPMLPVQERTGTPRVAPER